MSQSPSLDSSSDQIRSYDVGWAALNKMIRAGRSFSGNERHCCYLNIGPGRSFANISAPSGLDLPEDGRGLALADWDHDGRVDLWLTNRTGPRVRFFRNNFETENSFVAIRLEGVEANRDAIGARVTIHFSEEIPPVTKSLYAGSGYRSQSSKWLHFGLGKAGDSIERVTVRWPGGDAESFSGLTPGGHFRLRQGSGRAVAWEPPRVDSKSFETPAVDQPVSRDPNSRIVLLGPAPVPAHLRYTNAAGSDQPLAETFGAPLVLNLWATWCPNCEEEMRAWSEEAARFEAAGLGVLSICVDEPSDDRQADLRKALQVAKERNYPFPVGIANTALIENLNILQRTFIGRQTDLPLPSSFLIDAGGNLAVIYKGHVAPNQLLADQVVCGADPQRIMQAAIPLPGKWLRPPEPVPPRSVAIRLTDYGLLDDAKSYLEQLLPRYQTALPGESEEEAEVRKTELAECHHFLGAISYDQKNLQAAEQHYLAALEANPDTAKTRHELMRTYLGLGETAKAAEQVETLLAGNRNDFENLVQLAGLRSDLGQADVAAALYNEALELRPDHSGAHYQLANLLRDAGRCGDAIPHYRSALDVGAPSPLAANNLAWILATHPDAKLRNGDDAVKFATLANELTGGQIPPVLGTLAAAQAEAGEFDPAVATITRAVELARSANKPDLAERLESKLALYQAGKPFRDEELVR